MPIINRTVFYGMKNGKIAFFDWCLVNTSLGQMVEPFKMNRFNNDMTAFDINDEECLITELKQINFDAVQGMPPFADTDGTRLHAGILNPRTGF